MPQTATSIATGSAIPRGADAVLPLEEVETGDGVVRISHSVSRGSHIFPPGEDARAGDVLIESGALLRPSAPRSVLVVGFGAGVTAGSFVPYPEVGSIVICELEPLIPPASEDV